MATVKVRIEKELYEKLGQCAEMVGYSSVDELITHVLEKEVDRLAGDKADLETTKERLKGLGYLS
jgi:hypothetical protein